jgi:tRNA(fMet)-specific endonuclease VapC
MYCLDSDVIIALFRGDVELRKKITSLDADEISTTIINLCELLKGAYKNKKRERELPLIEEFIQNYRIFYLDLQSSHIFGVDFNGLEKIGKTTQEKDLMIASIAKANGLVLVTRNRKDFENIPDLKIEVW